MRCNHTRWLDIGDEGETRIIRQTARLRNIHSTLPRPSSQCPSLVLCFESFEKQYFPASESRGIYLRLDESTSNEPCPLFIANTTAPRSRWPARRPPQGYRCCSVTQETSFSVQEASHAVPRVLFPFVDVLCFMCANQYDIRDMEAHIHLWCSTQRTFYAELPMPEIVVLLSDQHSIPPQSLKRDLSQKWKSCRLRFSVVKSGQHTYMAHGLHPIRERILPALGRSRDTRARRKQNLSVNHFQELFEHAFGTQSDSAPFQYIQASRTRNPIASDLVQHLSNFVNVVPEDDDGAFVAESIASALLLDHLTALMHGRLQNVCFSVLTSLTLLQNFI